MCCCYIEHLPSIRHYKLFHLFPKNYTHITPILGIGLCQNYVHGVRNAGELVFVCGLAILLLTDDFWGPLVLFCLQGTQGTPSYASQPLEVRLIQILWKNKASLKMPSSSGPLVQESLCIHKQICFGYSVIIPLSSFCLSATKWPLLGDGKSYIND